jgi:hypothetical protein
MKRQQKQYSADLNARIAVEAVSGQNRIIKNHIAPAVANVSVQSQGLDPAIALHWTSPLKKQKHATHSRIDFACEPQ